jgi:hypothetical protein
MARPANPKLKRVISGGQVGTDVASLLAAESCGLVTGGMMPKGFRTGIGPMPEYAERFNLLEHLSPNYPPRTFWNVEQADATLRIAVSFNTPGEVCTMKAIKKYNKPHLDIPIVLVRTRVRAGLPGRPGKNEATHLTYKVEGVPRNISMWIHKQGFETLNVAGTGRVPVQDAVFRFLCSVFRPFGDPDRPMLQPLPDHVMRRPRD